MFQITEVLKKVPFFQTLGRDGIDFIVERLKFKPYDANEVICKIGDPGDKMYIIISGQVKVVVTSEKDQEEKLIATLGAGDYFGEMSLLTGEPRSASVITTEPSEMFILHKSDFDVIIERFPSITLSMGKIMSQRLRDTLQKAANTPTSGIAPSVKGSLSERRLVEVLKFCESNSLNGKVVVTRGGETGECYYEKGELQKVILGNLSEDQALDTMLNWEDGEFIIEPRPIRMDESSAPPKQEPREERRLIIVNNSMVVQKMLQRAFESMGYEVYAVDNGAKALKMIQSMDPHLIICDTKLPDTNGSELLNSIRAIGQIPVVFLTDASSRAQYEPQLSAKGEVYFTNSQEVGEVVKVVENALSK
ncbi:MAG: response regulator [Calditrichaeota bacterium]|nr:MAG: response regulator [Calditrichota bacterium]